MSCLRTLRPQLAALFAPPQWTAPAAAMAPAAQLLHPARRWASSSPSNRIPVPIPLVPDVNTFLSIIGRNMKQHAAKFPTWEALFTLTSDQLREIGVEPPRDRRYLLRWCQRFRDGRFGIGGDFAYVHKGVAMLQIREQVHEDDPLPHKKVVNVPATVEEAGKTEATETAETAEAAEAAEAEAGEVNAEQAEEAAPLTGDPVLVHGYKVVGARNIAGPYALPVKGHGGARVEVAEGMWEFKRGRKIDGGERRRAEVRFKRRVAERRAQREQLGLP